MFNTFRRDRMMTRTEYKAMFQQSPELADFLAVALGVSLTQVQLWGNQK